ncbi:GNAT family N-acetyltransferase [Clostridium sp. Marseille-P3244]|uniref:GNAT family N-acetyltransferase n=1 Tax=Clostridium sp. Marseille-P3244 TaxID=1871020 RepID=UPI000930A6E4|nr:GNAT family N-acetyltransferase [Clostridium sp. Marseille-P3244]
MDTVLMIKKADTDEQIRQIADLARIIWNEHFTPIIGKDQVDYMVEKFQSYPALKKQLDDGYEYYQIFDSGEFCGYTGIHPGEDGRLFLSKLYIRKDHRGRHLATRVFDFLTDLCRERGYSAVWLTCNKHNNNSLGIYRHLGFQTIDTQEADIGGGFIMDDYIMEYQVL